MSERKQYSYTRRSRRRQGIEPEAPAVAITLPLDVVERLVEIAKKAFPKDYADFNTAPCQALVFAEREVVNAKETARG